MKRKGGFDQFTLDDYTITEDGEVINNKWNRKVKPQSNGKGYLRVCIAGKMKYVHRLVAEKYIPNPNNYSQINHIDGNKSNNRVENLEWVTNQMNRDHAVKNGLHAHGEVSYAKLNWDKVSFIREHTELTSTALAKMYGVAPSTIREIRQGRRWKTAEKVC